MRDCCCSFPFGCGVGAGGAAIGAVSGGVTGRGASATPLTVIFGRDRLLVVAMPTSPSSLLYRKRLLRQVNKLSHPLPQRLRLKRGFACGMPLNSRLTSWEAADEIH